MLINQWYVLANADEIKDAPVGVRALGQDLVLFRDNAGVVHCLSDICVHKGGSLCRGKVVDGAHAVFVHTDFGNPEQPVVDEYTVEDSNNRIYGSRITKPLNKRGMWREEIPDDRSERKTEVQIYLPAPCIRIQMHVQPPKTMMIVTGYTPIDEYSTRLHFIQGRNFVMGKQYDEDALRRVHLVIEEDAVILNHLQPSKVPPTLADELLLASDLHGTTFRKKIKALEDQGLAIDSRAMKDEDDCSRTIPSPARRENAKNWVLKPVIMKQGIRGPGD